MTSAENKHVIGIYKDMGEAVTAMMKMDHLIEPDPMTQTVYEDLYQAWREFTNATRMLDKP